MNQYAPFFLSFITCGAGYLTALLQYKSNKDTVGEKEREIIITQLRDMNSDLFNMNENLSKEIRELRDENRVLYSKVTELETIMNQGGVNCGNNNN